MRQLTNSREQGKCHRPETEIAVTIHKNGENFSAILIDSAPGGIGVISEISIFPGSKIDITVDYVDDCAIHGSVKWMQAVTEEGGTRYRLGIEADQILAPEKIWEGFKKNAN